MQPSHFKAGSNRPSADTVDQDVCMIHITVQASLRIFSDEIHKHYFLEMLRASAETFGYCICAFDLLDDRFQMMIERENRPDQTGASLREELDLLIEEYQIYYEEETGRYGEDPHIRLQWEELTDEAAIMQCCVQIHIEPLKLGYVQMLQDYWFSSFLSYRGQYRWEMVNTKPLMQMLSAKPDLAKRKLLGLHRAAVRGDDSLADTRSARNISYEDVIGRAGYVAEDMKGF